MPSGRAIVIHAIEGLSIFNINQGKLPSKELHINKPAHFKKMRCSSQLSKYIQKTSHSLWGNRKVNNATKNLCLELRFKITKKCYIITKSH